MSYQTEFGRDFDLGFSLELLPNLVDQSWSSDVCPSFHFVVGDQFYVLWVDYKDKNKREQEGARYTVVTAENAGTADEPEVFCGSQSSVVFESEETEQLLSYLKNLDL